MHVNLFVVGIHNSHGEAQIDCLADLAYLLKKRPWGSRVLLVGDWNVDQLPTCANDPFSDEPGRGWHHMEERMRLNTLVDKLGRCTG